MFPAVRSQFKSKLRAKRCFGASQFVTGYVADKRKLGALGKPWGLCIGHVMETRPHPTATSLLHSHCDYGAYARVERSYCEYC